MLRAKAVSLLLAQVNGGGVRATLLVAGDGRLLAQAGHEHADAAPHALLSALAAHAHREYSTAYQASGDGIVPQFLLIECDDGVLAATPVCGAFLLVAVAAAGTEMGSIRLRLEAARRDLTEPLSRIGVAPASGDATPTAVAGAIS